MNLKKFGLLFAFGACCGIFAGCGDKEYTFEEALAVTQEKTSIVTDFMVDNLALKGDFDGSVSVKAGENQVVLKGKGNFQKDTDSAVSADIHLDVDGTVEGTKVPVKADLSFIANSGATYFSLGDFSFKGDGTNPLEGFVNAYVAEFKEKWFKLDLNAFYAEAGMDGFAQATQEYMDNYYAAMRDILTSDIQMKMYKEVGNEKYTGKFSEYQGKNAYQFVLDEESFQELMNKIVAVTEEYYTNLGNQYGENMDSLNESLDMIKSMHFDPFTGNLVIDGEDVIVVYDEMILHISDNSLTVSSHIGKDGVYFAFGMDEAAEGNTQTEMVAVKDAIVFDAKQKRENTYDFTFTVKDNDGEMFSIKGTITLDISDDKISVKVSVPFSNEEVEKADFDFSFAVEKADKVSITYPEETQDFMALLWSLLGGSMDGDVDYDMDYDMSEMPAMEDEEVASDETVSE